MLVTQILTLGLPFFYWGGLLTFWKSKFLELMTLKTAILFLVQLVFPSLWKVFLYINAFQSLLYIFAMCCIYYVPESEGRILTRKEQILGAVLVGGCFALIASHKELEDLLQKSAQEHPN